MNELVFLKNQQALTTSLKVAEYFEKEHLHIMRDIRGISEQLEDISKFGYMFHKANYADTYGRKQPMYLMNRDGFTLLAMGFTGKKALQFKLDYIQAFNAMESALVERQSEQWKELRYSTKANCKELDAAVHELYLFAVDNGCKVSEKVFHMNFHKLLNKTLGIKPNTRDKLDLWKLFEVDKLQYIAKTVIKGLLAKGEDYHLPYRDCKSAFESYARLSFINQRLLGS